MSRGVAGVIGAIVCGVAFGGPKPVLAETGESEEQQEQQFLFLLEDAYTQHKNELQLTPVLTYTKARGTELEINEDGAIEEKKQKIDTVRSPLEIQYGITDRLEVAAEGSLIWKRTDSTTLNQTNRDTKHVEDVGDTTLGVRYLLLKESDRVPALTVGYAVLLPTGDFKEELGFQHAGHEVSLAVSRDFGRWVGHLNVGSGIHMNETKLNEDGTRSKKIGLREISYGAAAVYRINDHWNGFLELSHEIEEGIAVNKRQSETKLVMLPGISHAFQTRWAGTQHEWEIGLGIPVGLTRDAADWGVIVKLKYEVQLYASDGRSRVTRMRKERK